MTPAIRQSWPLGLIFALGLGAIAVAQIEGGPRGIPPIDSSSNLEVDGIQVDVAGRTADQARTFGWRLAQRRGWKQLWARIHGASPADAPDLPDGTLDGIVAGISVEDEQIGAHRYIARLGVLFDRARAGDLLGGQSMGPRSAPTLVIPVLWSGGAPQSFEVRGEWQKAWAHLRTGGSAIDYVRPVGDGMDPLLLNVAQVGRPGRAWWRMLLDRYGASDVVVPVVHLERRWPGGPVIGHFTATHGPDGEEIARFDLVAPNSAGLARMLEDGVRRIDVALTDALRRGGFIADPTLTTEVAPIADLPEEEPAEGEEDVTTAPTDQPAPAAAVPVQGFTLQVDTPDDAALTAIQAALRGVAGVRGVTTTSLALGGTSLVRVDFAGDAAALRTAVAARGLQLDEALRLRRSGGQ